MSNIEHSLRWQAKKAQAGLCKTCGRRPLAAGSRWACGPCLLRQRERARARAGCRPRVPGGRGRPPLAAPPPPGQEAA